MNLKSLVAAIIKSQSEFPSVPKNKINPFLKNKYADLGDILTAVTPVLCRNGLALIHRTEIVDGKLCLKTSLIHESGESVDSVYPLIDSTDPQKIGAAITYARRYSVCSILGIVADDDDDGNAATPSDEERRRQALLAQAKTISDKAGWNLEDRQAILLRLFGTEDIKKVPTEKLIFLINEITELAKK